MARRARTKHKTRTTSQPRSSRTGKFVKVKKAKVPRARKPKKPRARR